MSRQNFYKKMSELMKNAWFLVRNYSMSLGDAMRQAWRIFKLKTAMHKGIVKFQFKKLDGSLRDAIGTLTDDALSTLVGSQYYNPSPKVVPYYDCEKGAWRSFRKELLIGMTE
jgi:hypothetical protein